MPNKKKRKNKEIIGFQQTEKLCKQVAYPINKLIDEIKEMFPSATNDIITSIYEQSDGIKDKVMEAIYSIYLTEDEPKQNNETWIPQFTEKNIPIYQPDHYEKLTKKQNFNDPHLQRFNKNDDNIDYYEEDDDELANNPLWHSIIVTSDKQGKEVREEPIDYEDLKSITDALILRYPNCDKEFITELILAYNCNIADVENELAAVYSIVIKKDKQEAISAFIQQSEGIKADDQYIEFLNSNNIQEKLLESIGKNKSNPVVLDPSQYPSLGKTTQQQEDANNIWKTVDLHEKEQFKCNGNKDIDLLKRNFPMLSENILSTALDWTGSMPLTIRLLKEKYPSYFRKLDSTIVKVRYFIRAKNHLKYQKRVHIKAMAIQTYTSKTRIKKVKTL